MLLDNRKVSKHALVTAIAINECGFKEVIGFDCFDTEPESSWSYFQHSLRNRGLVGTKCIVSDAHKGLKCAIARIFPEALWQRCTVHLMRNNRDRINKKDGKEIVY